MATVISPAEHAGNAGATSLTGQNIVFDRVVA